MLAKDEGSSVVREMDSADETEVNPRVFSDSFVTFTGNGSEKSEAIDQAGAFLMELDSDATDTGSDGNANGDLGSQVSERETKPRENRDSDAQFYELCNEAGMKNMGMASKEEKRVLDYKSFLSEFDDYVASEKTGSRVSRALSYGFEVGDMVWGKVKSHPWWPGQIFNEAFASPSVRRMKKMGYVLVAFFGDNSYGWFDLSELVPFEPHVAEKSQQTNSSQFAKAVEEAMDEVGRRSALGLTCKCRNPYNFKPTNVQGYFAIDVPDYELQVVYSSKQIQKARDSFSSVQTLAFVKWCALVPQECYTDSINSFQKRVTVYAFRRAVFEEFDETYEQAFRARSSVKTQQPLKRAPPQAPLSGSLVCAETLGYPKSSTKAMNVKDSTKQDKYLPKRREEAGHMTVQFGQVQASFQLQGINGSSAGGHVLQRRTQHLQTPRKHEQTGLVSMDFTSSRGDISGKKSSVSKLSRDDDKGLAQESNVRMGEKTALFPEHEKFEAVTSLKQDETGTHARSNKGSLLPFIEGTGVGIKKGNILKRSSGEMNSENGPPEPKKKKKKKKEFGSELNCGSADKRKALSSGEAWAKKSSQLDSTKRHSNMLTGGNSKLDGLQLLSNLQALSLDSFFGSSDRTFIKSVRQFFLRFRSLVYQKSLATSASTTKLSKYAKTLCRTNEPSKARRNRISSDHQEDVPSTKKLKKTIQFKPMASDKKNNQEATKRSSLAPFNPVRDQGGPVTINAKPAVAQPEKKTAPSEMVVEPTMLVIMFPPGTSLPSTALLKARFGRFGQLDQSAIRVSWKSSICRVVFLYKLDAQTALRYASGSNSIFGNVNVTYFLRNMKASSASGDHELKKAKTDEPIFEPLNQRLEQAPPANQPNIQLKSCLKKPGNNGNGNHGTARVKFMLGEKETETPFSVSGRNNGNYSSSSSSVPMEFVSKNTQNMASSTLPPVLPLSSQYSKPKPVNNQVDHVETPLNPSKCKVELLTRCNDVVADVTGLLGYFPYHRI